MKIAYDAKRFFSNSSGLGNYSRDLVRVLAQHFPQNQYVLLNKNQSERGKEILALPNVCFFQTSRGRLSRQLKMGKDAQALNADIFHGLSGELPLKWTSKPIKKVVTIHDLIFERYPEYYSFFDRKIHFWKFKKAARDAEAVIAISEQTKRDIIRFLNVSESKIHVVYQGCHRAFQSYIPPDVLSRVKQKFQLPNRFILNVGTIEPRKNLLNIIKALKDSDIPLVVVGKKQRRYFAKVQKEIHRTKVQVQFLEHVDMQELAAVYRLADVFIYPSYFEGFGIPVIEALFSGTPVITSNVSSLPEAGGKHSLYVNPESVADIKAKILFLWNNESERKRRREKNFEYAQRFQDEQIAEKIMEVYTKIHTSFQNKS